MAAASSSPPAVVEPFPIFLVGGRYTLYDINTVSHARRNHNITGVLIGGLPQAPQQNVFLGIPLELMPEEARLLVEKGVSYIVDDSAAHKHAFVQGNLSKEEKEKFTRSLKRQGTEATRVQSKSAEDRKVAALKKIAAKNAAKQVDRSEAAAAESVAGEDDDSLFSGPAPSIAPSIAPSEASLASSSAASSMKITPTTSHPPLSSVPSSSPLSLPQVPASYPLFQHLHAKGYFMAPGIRFGCRYTAYPGDPLRFHSHFLCDGMDWDEEFDLLRLVGGGRLGTGVKKGFLIGGTEKKDDETEEDVRTFCIEWAGM